MQMILRRLVDGSPRARVHEKQQRVDLLKQPQSSAQIGFRAGFVGGVLIPLATIATKASRDMGRIFFCVSLRGVIFFPARFMDLLAANLRMCS